MYFILKYELKYIFHSSAVIVHPLLDIRPESIDFWLFWASKVPVPFRDMVRHRAKSNLEKKIPIQIFSWNNESKACTSTSLFWIFYFDLILKCLFRNNVAQAPEHIKESQASFIFHSYRSCHSSVSERPWHHPVDWADKRSFTWGSTPGRQNDLPFSPSIPAFHKMKILLLCKEWWKLQKKKQTEMQWSSSRSLTSVQTEGCQDPMHKAMPAEDIYLSNKRWTFQT